jgi:GNAT superfamily N-acetyltransferase
MDMSKEIIRLATPDDIPPLMEGINLAKEQLFFHQSGQWQKGEPSQKTIQHDVMLKQYFVMEVQRQVVGGMALLFKEPAYDRLIEGAWLNNLPFGVIHRFFIHPSFQKQGFATQLLRFALDYCQQQNIYNLRIDTHEKNAPMLATLHKCGFIRVGKAYLPNAGERVVYHKVYE